MRLSYLAEVIATLAIGMALAVTTFRGEAAEDTSRQPDEVSPFHAEATEYPSRQSKYTLWNIEDEIAPLLLLGVAVAGGLGLLVERLRGRSPECWGVGRWVWAVSALYALTNGFFDAVLETGKGLFPPDASLIISDCRLSCAQLGTLLAVTWIAARFALVPRAPGADAREWTGRILAFAFVLQSVFFWSGLGSLKP